MIHRLLLVDDFEPWRRYLSATLDTDPWQVLDEAADGLDAVQKARNLEPDLILLDVGLPQISGIDAARRIFDHNPHANILFVSEHRSWEIAEAALATGARGYVLKSDAGRDLPLAMRAVVAGRRYVSPRLGGAPFVDDVQAATRRHEVAFYDDESVLIDGYARFAATALHAGSAFVVLATPPRLEGLQRILEGGGISVSDAIREGRYVAHTVADALPAFVVDGWPDEARFWSTATTMFMRAARAARGSGPRVAACGECAPALWRDGNGEAAIRLEHLWDEMCRTCDVDVFCAYGSPLTGDDDAGVFDRICAEHSAVHRHV